MPPRHRPRCRDRGRNLVPVAAAPTIASITQGLADSLGGSSHVIAGTGFTTVSGAGGVKFDTTNATSYVVDSATQITAVAPAHAAGAFNVTVVGSGGTSNGVAFESWDPTVPFAPTLLLEHPNYAINAGTGTFTARVGTNYTGTGATCPDDSPAGTPLFARANSDVLSSADTTATLIGLAHTVGFTVAMLLDVTAMPGVGGYDFAISDYNGSVGQFAVEWASDGTLYLYVYDGATKVATLAAGAIVVGRNVIVARRATNGDLTIQSNAGVESAATACGTIATQGTIYLGANPISAGIYRLSGRIKAMVTAKAKWSDANVLKFRTWVAARHPT